VGIVVGDSLKTTIVDIWASKHIVTVGFKIIAVHDVLHL
jgi:hypothetical protein